MIMRCVNTITLLSHQHYYQESWRSVGLVPKRRAACGLTPEGLKLLVGNIYA